MGCWRPSLIRTKIGASTFNGSGRKHSAADFLGYVKGLNVVSGLKRILLASFSADSGAKQTAVSVVSLDAIGLHRHAMLRENGVVLVCAGAIGSPQLLLLRGIWGIPVAFHSPYVAQYLNDNLRNGILILPPIALEHSSIQVSITELGDYVEAASNVMPFASPAQPISIRTPSNLHHFISL